jgi:hypothetical protein
VGVAEEFAARPVFRPGQARPLGFLRAARPGAVHFPARGDAVTFARSTIRETPMPTLRLLGLLLLAAVALCPAPSALAQQDKTPSGTVVIDQTQFALIFSGAFGGGTLHYKGKSYGFTIAGLGIGGIGIATMHATGDVYDLQNVGDFGGVYGQARAGYALGKESGGTLWLENPKGVYLHLKAEREGIILSLGADGVIIKMD